MRISEAADTATAMMKHNLNVEREQQICIPYFQGDPGLGKTTIAHLIAKRMGAHLIVERLADKQASDIAGWNLPSDDRTRMMHIMPRWLAEAMQYPDQPVIIFFDELPQGATVVQGVVGQAMNERLVGSYPVPRNVYFMAAGNPAKARAGTNHVPTHIRDRMTYLNVEADAEDTVAYFSRIGVDERIRAFLRFQPDAVSKFDRDADACPSPRSWERVSAQLQYDLPHNLKVQTIGGQVGDQMATTFDAYCKLIEAMPDMDKVMKDPANAPIPTDPGILYAVTAALVGRFTEDTADQIMTYVNRFTRQEIVGFMITDVNARLDEEGEWDLFENEMVREWALQHGTKYLPQ